MKMGIVKLSDLAREGRMDASFHLALQSVKERVAELRASMTADEAISRLKGLPLHAQQCLAVLRRGQTARSMSEADLAVVLREYPHLSLALLEQNLQPAIERIRGEIAKNEQVLDRLLEIATPTATCQRCDTKLDTNGRCTDETCPFSDCDQSDPAGWTGHPDRDPSKD